MRLNKSIVFRVLALVVVSIKENSLQKSVAHIAGIECKNEFALVITRSRPAATALECVQFALGQHFSLIDENVHVLLADEILNIVWRFAIPKCDHAPIGESQFLLAEVIELSQCRVFSK